MAQRVLLGAAGAAWVLGIGAGTTLLALDKLTPGVAAEAPVDWPAAATVPRETGKPTLVMLVHPQCPCTRASVQELARLQASLPLPVRTHVLFLRPSGMAEHWTHSDMWTAVQAIPGAVAWEDADGAQAHMFGAHTSGQVVLYSAEGALLFSGGITASRGHEGDNAGRSRLQALLAEGHADRAVADVYGCSLEDAKTSHAPSTGGT